MWSSGTLIDSTDSTSLFIRRAWSPRQFGSRRLRPRCQVGKQLSSGILLRRLLSETLCSSYEFRRPLAVLCIQTGFHGKGLTVFRPCFPYQHIQRLGQSPPFATFL